MEQYQQDLLDGLARVFRDLRNESRLTQREAALKANSTQARISDIELGKADILILTVQRWARVYGYDIEINFVKLKDQETLDFESSLAELMAEIEEEDGADNEGREASVLPEV